MILISNIRGAIGLRNIIVHMYADIDYELVLKELEDIINHILLYTRALFKCMEALNIDP